MKPRIQEPQDPEVLSLLSKLDTQVARTQEWKSAFRLTFGDEAFEEDYPCIDWSGDERDWDSDAKKFADALSSVPSSVDEGPPEKCNAIATHENRLFFHFLRKTLSERGAPPGTRTRNQLIKSQLLYH